MTFSGDGAIWIWDRVAKIIQKAKLEHLPCQEVLDCCHAVHHIALALTALGIAGEDRKALFRMHRTNLRNGHWRQVVAELTECAADLDEDHEVHTEIAYLAKHGQAGRLAYVDFEAAGLPKGSGAIESTIRRVINQRLKGVGIFWDQGNGEGMLLQRSLVIANRWDEALEAMRTHERHHPRNPWRREPLPMAATTEAEDAIATKAGKQRKP